MLQPRPRPQWPFYVILFAAPLVFFATEHSLDTSLADAFTQSPEEMLKTVEGGNTIRRIAYPAFGMMGLFLLCSPSLRTFRLSPVMLSALGFLAFWCGCSVLWSIDSGITMRRIPVLYCLLLAAWGTARHLNLNQILWLTLLANLTFLIIGFLAELSLGTFRPWAGDHRFSGTLHPNSQGLNLAAMCFAAICLVRNSPKHRWFLWSTFWAGVVFLYLTKSRTSFLGMLLTLGVIWSLSVPFFYKFMTVCLGGWCLSLAAVVFLLGGADLTQSASDAALMGREEQSESLTGRLPLWTELGSYVSNRFLQGHGYESFWTPGHIDEMTASQGWGLREAHNSYLEAILSIGMIGLLAALFLGLLGLLRASHFAIATKHPGYAFLVALIFFGVLNGLTESSMMDLSFYTYLLASGLFYLALNPVDDAKPVSPRMAHS